MIAYFELLCFSSGPFGRWKLQSYGEKINSKLCTFINSVRGSWLRKLLARYFPKMIFWISSQAGLSVAPSGMIMAAQATAQAAMARLETRAGSRLVRTF